MAYQTKDNKATDGMQFHRINYATDGTVKDFIDDTIRGKDAWRYSYERTWFTNIAMISGQQWMIWDKGKRSLTRPSVKPYRAYIVANYLLPIKENTKAKVLKAEPNIDVMPATSDDEDAIVSRLNLQVARYYWRRLGFDQIMDTLLDWTCSTGNGFLKVAWNPKVGRDMTFEVEDMLEREPIDDNDYESLYESAREEFFELTEGEDEEYTVQEGDIEVEELGPFGVLWDEVDSFKKSPWAMVSKLRDVSYIQEKYGEDAEGIDPDHEHDAINTFFERRIARLNAEGTTGDQDNVQNVMVHEFFVRPTPEMPKGYYAVVTGGKLIESGDNPYRCIPIVHLGEVMLAGRALATSFVEQCTPLQVDYNKAKSQIIENREATANPKILLPESCNVASNAWTGQPGEKVPYNPDEWGNKPEYVYPPPIPVYVTNEQKQTLLDMQDLSGHHEVTQSKSRSGDSGYKVDLLLEQDETRFGPFTRRVGIAVSETFGYILKILRMYVSEERIITIAGKDMQRETDVYFTGDDLVGSSEDNPGINYHDIKIDYMASLSESRSAKKESVVELINLGFLQPGNPIHENLVFKNMGLTTGADDLFQESQEDQIKAKDENLRMKKGEQIPVMYWENHAVELLVHNRLRKSKEFNDLHDDLQEMINNHCAEHEQFEQQNNQRMAMEAQGLQAQQ